MGQSTEALNHLNIALAIFEQFDRQREIANVCCNLGDLHLRRAEHAMAKATLRRSLSIAEQVGAMPIMSAVLGNLGVLAARLGDQAEAETWYRRGLTLAEQINDPVYISLLNIYLAIVMQDQGKFAEATACIRRALSVGRAMNIASCLGFALITLGYMRIVRAVACERDGKGLSKAILHASSNVRTRLLTSARLTLQRALSYEGLEAEMKTEGQLLLAQVSLLSGEPETARREALHTMEEAQDFELNWLLARSQGLLGSILAIQGQQEQAFVYFTKAIQVFHDSGMRLEQARTLQSYGLTLIRYHEVGEVAYRQGLNYLQEAQQIFEECNAIIDLKRVKLLLSENPSPALTPSRRNNKRGS
jgi:tetratricopeptide (TPR) repeat protein